MVYMFVMHEVNLNGLDLNLLPPLEALLRRKNVTLAAADAGMSQPAMSRALGRLRTIFDDPLLARGAKGLVLTPKALEISFALRPALEQVKQVFHAPDFDPKTSQRTIRFASSDVHNTLIFPTLLRNLSDRAPGLDISCEPYGSDLLSRMAAGDIDFAFALDTSPLPTGAQSLYLAQDELALVMRRNHPLATHDWTLSDYGKVPHILIRLLNDGVNDLDALLAVHGIQRRTLWSTPHFLAALAAVSTTDAVTTLSRAFAGRFADQFDLVLRRPPIDNPSLGIVLVMAQARGHDPLMAWVANQVKLAATEVYAVASSR
jgi:DNA-binding transcriptional LysR family regulator